MIREIAVHARGAAGRPATSSRLLLFAQGRTGTWLLTNLLNQHPAVHCDKEILRTARQWPYQYMAARSRLHGGRSYGCHIQVGQLVSTQHRDPTDFIARAVADGWRVVRLTRQDIVRQSISTILATKRQQWVATDPAEVPSRPETINPDELLDWLERRRDLTALEDAALDGVKHLHLTYETDLVDASMHQATMGRVFRHFGIDTVEVAATTQRLSADLDQHVVNFAEIVETLRSSEFAECTDLC